MARLQFLSAALFLAVSPAWADEHIYSYDAASDAARALAATGLSFQFEDRLLGGYKLQRVIQTGERGSADIRQASESALGTGGVKAALGRRAPVGALYEILSDADGPAFIEAVCPGAQKAWLIIGPLRRFKDLPIQAVGRDPGAAAARHCVDLTFSFHSDWRLPDDRIPPRVRFSGRPPP